jgi:4-hydroxy-3-methylbut-2-enyl diphosphate reductase
MRVVLAKSAGFCWGVQRAIDKALALARSHHSPIYTDGPLIHNRPLMEQLRSEGVTETATPEALKDSTLLVRAHGIPPERRRWLRTLPLRLADATCPDVARIQGLILKHVRQDRSIVIYGDAGHAEVLGLLGYCGGRGHVVTRPEDVTHLPDMPRVCLVSQSTQFPLSFEAVARAVLARFPDTVVLNTICAATRNRQQELIDICHGVDAIVVVGDLHSANTLRLVELAESRRPTFHVQTVSDLDPVRLRHFRSVGLTAGASTPAFLIEAVQRKLEAMDPAAIPPENQP